MDPKPKSRLGWIVAAVVIGVLIFAAFNLGALKLGVAVALSEKRPTLLRDAHWQDPSSARRFDSRFRAGAAERDLLEWLDANRFTVDRTAMKARRDVASLPCNEHVEITWSSDGSGRLRKAEATVSEAGCL